MKLTRASNYAVQAVVAMAAQHDGLPVAAHLTAQSEGIPDRFLLKILLPLVSAGVLYSRKGPGGGYHLAKPASKITLLEIVEAVDGPLRGEVPALRGKGTDTLDQRLTKICQQVTNQTRSQLGKVSVAELASREKARKK
jgi:Rrf2 family protein